MKTKSDTHSEENSKIQDSTPKACRKNAKKAFSTICIVCLSLLLLGVIGIGVLHMKGVQTYIIGKVTQRLETMLDADVRITQFHYRPLSYLTIDSIYLSDQQHDTLVFVDQIQVEFQPLQLRYDRIDVQLLRLQNPYINLQSTSDSTLNIQFLIDAFKSDSASFPFRLNVDSLQLEQTRLRYNEILVDQLNLDMSLPVFSQDSLDVRLHSLHLRAQLDELDATFEADLSGGLDSVSAQNMRLAFRNQQLFSGDIKVLYPMDLGAMQVEANCNDLYYNKILIEDLLSQLKIGSITLPAITSQLKNVHYQGDIKGRLEQLKMRGTFSTSLGHIRVNGTLKSDTTLQNLDFYGHMHTQSFKLGRLLEEPNLGSVALQADVNGKIVSNQLAHCTLQSNIQKLEYRGYDYQNILVNGKINPEEINGTLRIDDENIRLNIEGLVDWSRNNTRLNFVMHIADFKPGKLNLISGYPDLILSATSYANLCTSGQSNKRLDNMTGYLTIDSLRLNNKDAHLVMEQFNLDVNSDHVKGRPKHHLRIQSDFLTANLSGSFQYSTLPATVQQLLNTYLPNLIDKPAVKHDGKNSLDFYAYFRKLDSISHVLDIDMSLPSLPTIKGYLREENQQFGIQAFIPYINTSGTNMENVTISFDNEGDQLDLSVFVLNHLPKDNPTAAKIGDIKANIYVKAKNDELALRVDLGNTDSVRNEGEIHAISKISKYNNKPKFDIEILPTNIVLNDSAWSIGQSTITYLPSEKTMDIHNLALYTDYQSITANGRASESAQDSVDVTLHNINLDYLLSYTEAKKVISIMGPATGKAHIYSMFAEPMLEAQAQIPNGGLNGVYLGDVTAEAMLDRENKTISIYGQIIDSTAHVVAEVNGKVIPANKWWGLDINCDSLDIHFIDAWTNNIIANPQGRGYGSVKVAGQDRKVWVTGQVLAKNAQVTAPQIGVTFHLNDSIYLDSTAIRFPDITMHDQFGNQGTFDGILLHKHFLDFRYNLRATAKNMLVMDLPADQQSFFYGQVFGTGDVHIYGDDQDCQIDVHAKTDANTKFYLNINSASQATTSNFIHFVESDTTSNYLLNLLKPKQTEVKPTRPESRTRLSIQGEVTPDADIIIKLGGEDGIKGRGEGNLKLVYESPSGNIHMQGNYVLQSGKFDFSLGNIVRRNFTIREGSKITWDSDPLAPMVDINGYYHTTASLRDLFGSESSQIATDRISVPVNCVLRMTDQLFNPILNFAIELPQSDESVQSQVNSMINTDEMLMRQVIYLLVFNRFYTPDYLQNTQNVGLNETYSLLSSTITGQINSWLSKLTDVFTMGFNFRTDGEGETASQEYEANFQIHPINQLIINGNFGYRYNDLSNRPFFGDLDIEYLLTENGKLRAKAFTHTVDKYSLRQANTVQGVGFVFKHNFNWGDRKKKAQQEGSSPKNEKGKKKIKEQ